MEKTSYLIRRIAEMVLVVFVVAVINFSLIHLAPGDVATIMAGGEGSAEYMDAVRHEYGLNFPLHVQLGKYLWKLLRGDLGYSIIRGERVADIMLAHIPNTLLLMFPSLVIGSVLGVLGGAWAARYLGTKRDSLICGISVAAYSVPVFWLALVLVYTFSVNLHWLPSSGMTAFQEEERGVFDLLKHMTLPVLSLSIYYVGQNIKIARASVAESLREDYVTTFRAAGFSENSVFLKHALRNALLPIVSMTGLQFAYLATGAILTETVFSWPGMGQLLFQAVLARDYPLIMGGYTLMSVMVVSFTLLVDIVYVYLDPRIQLK